MTTEAARQDPVLVPVDFSQHSEAALAWAADLALRIGAPLVVLHVVHDPAEAPGYYLEAQFAADPTAGPGPRQLADAAALMMDHFLDDAKERYPELARVSIEQKLVVGIPTRRILEVAEGIGARLIVMGSQGRTGISRALLGSKAEQVVRLSPRPVTIVKRAHDPRAS